MALKINSASGSITLTAEDGSGNANVTIPRDGIVSDLSDLSITATAAEINILDGVTSTATELNYVDGVTSNIQTQLDAKGTVSTLADLSVTATAAELNILDGATLTTTELNYVDGVTSAIQTQLDAKGTVSSLSDLSITATATELNYVDGVTSNIQTQLDGKGTVSTLADLSVTATATELNLLDGVTATTAELNYIDGVTSNIQTQLDQKAASLTDLSVTATAAELNILDGATLTTTELNYVDGVTSAIQTQIDGKLSTSLKGAASGLAELDSSGLVPTSQLPSYVDDVLEYTNASSFPGTGETGKIYVALDTNDIYRWSGSAYVKVSDAVSTSDQATALATARTISLTGDVTGSTSFEGSADVSISATIADDSHNHVISNVDGLQTALDAKAPTASPTFTGTVTSGDIDITNSQNGETNLDITNTNTGSAAQVRTKYTTDGGLFTVGKTSNAHAFGGDAYVQNVDNTNIRFATNDTEAMRIDNSQNVLIGTTSTGSASGGSGTAGINFKSDGAVGIGRSANPTLFLNRTTSDGTIMDFRKNGVSIGAIGTENSHLTIGKDDTGIKFQANENIIPWNLTTNAARDNTIDFGNTLNRYRSIYLGGGVVENTTTVTYASSIALSYTNGSIQTVTLTGNVTFTDSLNDGEAVVLHLNAGASYTVTWTAVTKWVTSSGNVAPTLTANDTVVIWKIGTTVYAAYAGSYA